MSYPLISVIIPVYNSESTIRKCLESLNRQTYTNYEILIVDDGSTDNSLDICKEVCHHSNNVHIFHKENGGSASARNLGLEKAKGEWITFVDSDDWVYPDYLNNYVLCVNNNVDLIVQGFKSNKPLFLGQELPEDGYFSNFEGNILDGIPILQKDDTFGFLWIKLFNTTIIRKYALRFNENFNLLEDEEFILRYLTHCKRLKATDDIGYFYNVPDWLNKYPTKNNSFELYQSMYESALRIYKHSFNDVTAHYLNMFTDTLFEILLKSPEKYNRQQVLEYRKVAFKHLFKSRLNFLTQLFIYIDMTGYVSGIFIQFYTLIKRILNH